MLHINPTAVIINPSPVSPTMTERLLRRMGADAFAAGRSFFDLQTTWERAGYRDACISCADADTDAYLAQRGAR